MNYRFKEDLQVIRFPQGLIDEDRGLKACCPVLLVLASTTDSENWKNDVEQVTVKKSAPSDIVNFVVTKCGSSVPLSNLGDQGIYPQDTTAFGFVFDWKQYLITYGVGKYTISVEFTISGVTGGYQHGQYDLQEYSIMSAANTVRVWSEPSTYSERELIDYTGSNIRSSIRFLGFFGDRQPKTVINNLVSKGRVVEKVTRENLNEYTLKTNLIDNVVMRALLNYHFINEDVLLITDHNATNPDYHLFDLPVVLEGSPEPEYLQASRTAKLTATFGDRKKLDKSYYNLQ